MQPFDYVRPSTLPEVLALLEEHGSTACLIAGGTDVVVGLRNRSLRPGVVIDLKRVGELNSGIVESGQWLRIGATTTMAQIVEDATIRSRFPALGDSAFTVGSIQIRNRATLTGNLCHASPAADTAPALLVYGAVVNLASTRGARRVNVDEFFLGPRQTALESGELVTSIDLPMPSGRRAATFARITRRRGVDLATMSVCCLVDPNGATRFAFGAVGPRPFLAIDDTGVLQDPNATEVARDGVLRRLLTRASPISDVRGSREYRAAMLLVMSRRVLGASIERLRAS
ncbi:MAG TPA: xanthine dehydrogenase family protein subunit M [Candidatus Dormibacteraeota bacterium]|nr:xanthine dehydrogenase family protein subunit M [Candidatus Dormibacteraeota bacterium]